MLHIGTVAIPKSTNEGRIKENLAATKINLTPEEVERIKGVDKNKRLFGMESFTQGMSPESVFDTAADEACVVNEQQGVINRHINKINTADRVLIIEI